MIPPLTFNATLAAEGAHREDQEVGHVKEIGQDPN